MRAPTARSCSLVAEPAAKRAAQEVPGLLVAAHEHADLDDARSLVVVAQREPAAGVLHDPDGAQVQARCQAPVEPHLFAAHGPLVLEGAVVEERQLDRPLDLQHLLSGDEDPRPVRLVDLDARRAPRIKTSGVASPDTMSSRLRWRAKRSDMSGPYVPQREPPSVRGHPRAAEFARMPRGWKRKPTSRRRLRR